MNGPGLSRVPAVEQAACAAVGSGDAPVQHRVGDAQVRGEIPADQTSGMDPAGLAAPVVAVDAAETGHGPILRVEAAGADDHSGRSASARAARYRG